MAFREDYFRRIIEQIEETAEERVAEQRRGDQADTLEHVDVALAERHRPHPERLRLTLDPERLEDLERLKQNLDELYVVRTTLCRRLQTSKLERETVLFLMRSVLVGTERLIQRNRPPGPPAQLLADILRQERISRMLEALQMAECWRVLFELESDRDNYAFAEDYLFHAVRLAPDPEALIHRGLDFYGNLLELPDRRLEKGGLPRPEAKRARWELLEKLNAL